MTTLKQIISNKTAQVQQANAELAKLNNIQTAIDNLCRALDTAPEFLNEGLQAIQHRLAEYGVDILATAPEVVITTSTKKNAFESGLEIIAEGQVKSPRTTTKKSWMDGLKVTQSVAEVAKGDEDISPNTTTTNTAPQTTPTVDPFAPDDPTPSVESSKITDPFAPDEATIPPQKTPSQNVSKKESLRQKKNKSSWMNQTKVLTSVAEVDTGNSQNTNRSVTAATAPTEDAALESNTPQNTRTTQPKTPLKIPVGTIVYHELAEIQGEVVAADENGVAADEAKVWVRFSNKWIKSLTHFQFKTDELKIMSEVSQ